MPGPKYTAEQKSEFFDLLDRGGSVRAAARAVGVHQGAAYSWIRIAGLSMRRSMPRVYTEEEKAEFFRRLSVRANVSAVARELGFLRVTCYAWAHRAGIFTGEARKVNPRREKFLRLRSEGLSRPEAAAQVSADGRSAADWDKGIVMIHRGRVYPDGRIVRYVKPTLSGMKAPRHGRAIGGRVDLNRVEKVIHSRYLSLIEREHLRDFQRAGMSIRRIATAMQFTVDDQSRVAAQRNVDKRLLATQCSPAFGASSTTHPCTQVDC